MKFLTLALVVSAVWAEGVDVPVPMVDLVLKYGALGLCILQAFWTTPQQVGKFEAKYDKMCDIVDKHLQGSHDLLVKLSQGE